MAISEQTSELHDAGWTDSDIDLALDIFSTPIEHKEPIILTKTTEKCVCGKIVNISKLESINTGVVMALNDVCKGCKQGEEIDKNYARIVCRKCKRVLARITPAKDKTGFTFKAGKNYHVIECGRCTPGVERCYIIEKVLWDKKHNKK